MLKISSFTLRSYHSAALHCIQKCSIFQFAFPGTRWSILLAWFSTFSKCSTNTGTKSLILYKSSITFFRVEGEKGVAGLLEIPWHDFCFSNLKENFVNLKFFTEFSRNNSSNPWVMFMGFKSNFPGIIYCYIISSIEKKEVIKDESLDLRFVSTWGATLCIRVY